MEKEQKEMYISNNNKILLGVCGSFAEYLNINPWIIRNITLAAYLFFGFGVYLGYFILFFKIPKRID